MKIFAVIQEEDRSLVRREDLTYPSIEVDDSIPDEHHFKLINELIESFGIQACAIRRSGPNYAPELMSGLDFSEEELVNLGLKWATIQDFQDGLEYDPWLFHAPDEEFLNAISEESLKDSIPWE